MRGSRGDIPATLRSDEVVIREAEWSDIHVEFETYNEEFDIAPLLKGLPDDMCQCPHYGYVLKGRMKVRYADREEIVNAGDAYYMAPVHSPVVEAGTELVEFSPKDEYWKTMEVAERNFAAVQVNNVGRGWPALSGSQRRSDVGRGE
jgi:hypothetical protein